MNKSITILGFTINTFGGTGDGSIGKVLAMQHEGLSSDAPNLLFFKSWGWHHLSVIPALTTETGGSWQLAQQIV